MNEKSPQKSAWVQLYEARRPSTNVATRSPGRPPAPIPRRKVGFTLSQGEIHELEKWQDRFSELLDRKVSTGETIGILTRICSARFSLLETDNISSLPLDELVALMIDNK